LKPLDFFRGSPPPKAEGPVEPGQGVPPTLSSSRRLFRTAALVIGLGLACSLYGRRWLL
jgi:hypothetical protein